MGFTPNPYHVTSCHLWHWGDPTIDRDPRIPWGLWFGVPGTVRAHCYLAQYLKLLREDRETLILGRKPEATYLFRVP